MVVNELLERLVDNQPMLGNLKSHDGKSLLIIRSGPMNYARKTAFIDIQPIEPEITPD